MVHKEERKADDTDLFESSLRDEIADNPNRGSSELPELLSFEQVHVPWQFSKKSGRGSTVNVDELDDEEAFEDCETYDSISCIAVEMQYQAYLNSREKSSAKSNGLSKISFYVGSSIDFDSFVETSNYDESKALKRKVRRLEEKERAQEDVFRPMGSQRFTNAENFSLKDENGQSLKAGAYAWLVKRYVEVYGTTITKRSLRDGLLKEIHSQEKLICGLDDAQVSLERQDHA